MITVENMVMVNMMMRTMMAIMTYLMMTLEIMFRIKGVDDLPDGTGNVQLQEP